MSKKLTITIVVSIILLALPVLFTGCATVPPTEAPVPPTATTVPPTATTVPPTDTPATTVSGSIKVLFGEPFANFDPHNNFILASWSVQRNLFDQLVTVDSNGTPLPLLAESWSIIDDTTWEFKLVKDVFFHDGTPFDAKAAKYTIDRVGNPENGLQLSGLWLPARAEIIDNYTIRVLTDQPFGKLLYALAITDIIMDGDADRSDFVQKPIGTGPFSFVSQEGDRITVRANEDYWRGSPRLQDVVFEYIPDPNVRLTALQTGEAQLIDRVTVDQQSVIEGNPELMVIVAETWETTYINFRNTSSAFFSNNTEEQNLLIRQALFHAIDRETIHETILGGLGRVSVGPTTSNLMDFSDFKQYDYNPGRAKELLTEAGYPDGFSGLTLYTSDGQWPKTKEIAEAVANYWKDVGVIVDVQVLELGTLVGHIFDNTGDFVHFGAVITNGDAAGLDGHIYSGEDTTGWHFTGYKSDRANELVRTARSAVDPNEFRAAAKELDRYIWDNALYISLFETGQIMGASRELRDFSPSPGLIRYFWKTYLDQ